jgi:hypothetical protein
MSCTTYVPDDQGLLCLVLRNGISPDDCLEALLAEVERSESATGLCVLCDVTEARSSLAFAGLWRILELVRQRSLDFVGSRWAIVAPDPLRYGLSRMAGTLLAGQPIEVRVFHDEASAQTWFGLGSAVFRM